MILASRHGYLGTLLVGAVGAAVVLLSVRQGWARVVTIEPRPLPDTAVTVTGQDLVPAAGALGLAALAGLAAVLATRRLARRLVGVVLVAFGAGIAAVVAGPLTDAQVRAAVVTSTAPGQGGTAAGASTVTGSGGGGGAGVAGVSLVRHVTMAGVPWRWAVLLGALLVLAAGLLVAWQGAAWPVMSSRYDRSAAGPAEPADPAALWESLSQGLDPTVPARGGDPPEPPASRRLGGDTPAARPASPARLARGDDPPEPPAGRQRVSP